MELCSRLDSSLSGKRIWKRLDSCICVTELLCCASETNTASLIDCTPIQNRELKKTEQAATPSRRRRDPISELNPRKARGPASELKNFHGLCKFFPLTTVSFYSLLGKTLISRCSSNLDWQAAGCGPGNLHWCQASRRCGGCWLLDHTWKRCNQETFLWGSLSVMSS